jgi:hypothetical protein
MGKFSDLLYYPEKALEAQTRANEKLPSQLRDSNLNLWHLGDQIETQGTRYLIGIAVWSVYDLRLLDKLDAALLKKERNVRIDVFNIDWCKSQEEISAYVPEIDKVFATPVVGVWKDGKQIKQASNYLGRMILVEAFSLNDEELCPETSKLNGLKNDHFLRHRR